MPDYSFASGLPLMRLVTLAIKTGLTLEDLQDMVWTYLTGVSDINRTR